MKPSFTIVGLAMMILSAAFAGCTGNDKEDPPAPAPSTSAMKAPGPAPSKEPPVAPPKAEPGIAYNETGAYTMQNAPAFPAFNVTSTWSKLTISYYLNATSGCYVIGSEPPQGLSTGAAPMITIKPPVSSAFSFELPPGPGSCGTANGLIKHDKTVMANEMGLWTVTVTGRGQNLDLVLLVTGE